MNAQSVSSALRDLKQRGLSTDAYVAEVVELADLDRESEAVLRAERLFALRARVRELQRRIKRLEAQR